MVVLRGDKDEPVEPADDGRPLLCVGVLVRAHVRGQRLVQMRQGVVDEVDELEFGVGSMPGLVHHPESDVFAEATRAGASENDGDAGHVPSSSPHLVQGRTQGRRGRGRVVRQGRGAAGVRSGCGHLCFLGLGTPSAWRGFGYRCRR